MQNFILGRPFFTMAPKSNLRVDPRRSNDPVGMAAAEAAAARRLAVAAESAALDAEREAEEAAEAAKAASEAKALADKQLAEELEKLRSAKPQFFSPDRTIRRDPGSSSQPAPAVVQQFGGGAERDYREMEISSMPKRSIKEIKARDREMQKAKEAAARNTTGTPIKPTGSADVSPTRRTPAMSPVTATLPAPTVRGDAWEITEAKKAAQLKPPAGGRNRFDLMSAPDTKVSAKIVGTHVDQYSPPFGASATEAKAITQGAIKKDHVNDGKYKGVFKGAGVTETDYMLALALQTQRLNGSATLLAPKSSQYVGVAPHLPLDEKWLQTTREQQHAIREADAAASHAPGHLEAVSFLSQHYTHAAMLAFEAHQQDLPRSKGGVYPKSPVKEGDEEMVTPWHEVDEAPGTPASVVLSQLRAPATPDLRPPPPKMSNLW